MFNTVDSLDIFLPEGRAEHLASERHDGVHTQLAQVVQAGNVKLTVVVTCTQFTVRLFDCIKFNVPLTSDEVDY